MNGHGSILNGHAHAGTDIAALRKALTTALSDLDAAAIRKNIETMVGLASESKDVQYGSAIADAVVNAVCGPAASHGMPAAIHVNGTAGSASLKERMEQAIAAIKAGGLVVVMDGEDRENEGDLIMAAALATPEKIAFMVNETSGLICVSLEASRCEELELPQMVKQNTESHQTAFTVSVDYKQGTSTGISGEDRSATFRALANPNIKAADFARPGHVFPLRAKAGGVLVRPGHTEASLDLARLAGLFPSGVLCEIVNKDGSMARAARCKEFAITHGLPFITIADIIAYRQQLEASTAPSVH